MTKKFKVRTEQAGEICRLWLTRCSMFFVLEDGRTNPCFDPALKAMLDSLSCDGGVDQVGTGFVSWRFHGNRQEALKYLMRRYGFAEERSGEAAWLKG